MKGKAISIEDIVSWADDIIASDIDDEKVMMCIEKGKYYKLDPVGRSIWDMIEKPVKVSDVINALIEKYDVDRETCEHDVLAFLEELDEGGILQVSLAAGPAGLKNL
jgi:hypothetical protein